MYLAQDATCTTTMSCCIRAHPTNAAEACGAAAWEIAEVLQGARVLNEAAQAVEDSAQAKARDNTPEWKKQCIEQYNQCIDGNWLGTWTCHDCFRYCEGQQGTWPEEKCYPSEAD